MHAYLVTMELIFQPSDGDQFTMEVGNSYTVFEIKLRIQELIGILIDRQTLIFDGDILPDHLNLRHSQIVDGSTIHLHLQRNDPELQIELNGILSNYSLILSSPSSDQIPTHANTRNHPPTTIHQQPDPTTELCVILHQSPTLIVENSPSSTVRSVTSSILQLDNDQRISRINRMIPRPGERPAYPPCFYQTLIHAGAENQPPFTLLRRQHCFHYSTRTVGRFTIEEFSTRPGADVENCASNSTHQSLTLTVERSPSPPITILASVSCSAAAGDEPRNEIRFVCVLYEAGRFTVMLRAYIRLAANVEVPPSSSRLSFIGHLLGVDISDQSGQQSASASSSVEERDSNRGKGVVREDIAESSGTSADGNVENRSAAGTSADGNSEDRSAAAPPNRNRPRTVHDVVSGRETGCMKAELIVVVIYRDQRSLVVVRHWEQVSTLRERLVHIHFRLPRPIYIFLHRHRIMDEHLTFEHNLVEHGDYIQPFPAFIL